MFRTLRNNESLLQILDAEKVSYLFTSESLATILEVTTSVKTRLAIILSIAPRLTDPRSRMDHFLSLFRFSEEKTQVEEALKTRIQAITGSIYMKTESFSALSPGRGRGRGVGSAAGGRGGRGGSRETSSNIAIAEPFATKPRAVSMPIQSHTRDLLQAMQSTVQSTSPVVRNRDSDDDEDDEPCIQQSFKPFGNAKIVEHSEETLSRDLDDKCSLESS